MLSDAGDELVVAGTTGLPADALVDRFGRIPLSSALPAAEVIRTGEPVVVTSDGRAPGALPRASTACASISTPPSSSCR